MGLLMACVTGILNCIGGVFFSTVARRRTDMIAFNFALFLSIAVLSLAFCNWSDLLHGNVPQAGRLIPIMVLSGLGNLTGIFLMIVSMRRGPQAASYTFAQCAMIWPFVAGVMIWGDPSHPLNYLGVALIAVCIAMLARKPGHDGQAAASLPWLGICLTGFVVLGVTQILCTLPSRWPGWQDAARVRIPLLYIPGALMLAAVCKGTRRPIPGGMIRAALVCSVVALTSIVTVLSSLDNLARVQKASLVFPIVTGINVTAFACYSRLWLKERLGIPGWSGVALGVTGILLLGVGR